MKVLMINGSPHKEGNTATALQEMKKVFEQEGVEAEIVNIGNDAIRGCVACGACRKLGKCVYDDLVNEIAPKFEEADGLVVGSPVYYASANASLVAVLDRLFHSTGFAKTMKVGAGVVVARRGGLSATFDELNKYFTISGMPVASSQNADHARTCTEYDILDEEYPAWKREVRTAGDRAEDTDQFYTVRDYESHRQILLNADGFYKYFWVYFSKLLSSK